MRNKLIIAACLNFCLVLAVQQFVAAQSKQPQAAAKPIKLKIMPELNARLPISKRETFGGTVLMTASGGLSPSFGVEFEGLKFLVATGYKSKRISFISTRDERFKTEEGVMVGDTLQKVLETSPGEVVKEPGWAFFVRLKSGWRAAFVQGAEMTEGELPPEAKVSFLFKR